MRLAGLALVLLHLAAVGCTSPSARVSDVSFGDAKALATTGNLRLVTERSCDLGTGSVRVLCTEPSPDYAIEFGTKTSGNAKVTIADKGNGEGALTVDETEKATELQGRTAAVLALRDGLYAACQSYANGVIGHDAYSMILSQYGMLLVALVGGTGETGDKGKAGRPVPAAAGTARQATLSALLVACVSGHDRTRLPLEAASTNDLLTQSFCRSVLNRALSFGIGA